MKLCKCGRFIRQGEICKCHSRYQTYNKFQRNKEKQDFYYSLEWQKLREFVKERANGLDEYALKYENQIVKGEIAHHIYPIDEWPAMKYSLDNLIFVSKQTHNKIHAIYSRGGNEKNSLQTKLLAIRGIGAVSKSLEK